MHKMPEEIGSLSMYSFYSLLGELGKRLNWDSQIAVASLSGKIDQNLHPLHNVLNATKAALKNANRQTGKTIDSFMSKVNG